MQQEVKESEPVLLDNKDTFTISGRKFQFVYYTGPKLTWGPSLSPQLYNKHDPPSTPVKHGGKYTYTSKYSRRGWE